MVSGKTLVLAGVLTISGLGCALNPATGRRQLSLISEAQEIELGREAAKQVQQTLGFVNDPDLQKYVQGVGRKLAVSSERPALPWEFHVVDDPTPNAFALPGGFIYITRGMMNLLTSEAELASVLGHEIAHVTARHSVNQISKQQLTQLGLGLGGIVFPTVQEVSPVVGAGLSVLFLKYSRDDEREADEIGFAYVRRESYAVSEFADVFAALERAGGESPSGLPNWLSTHPAPAERVETARARAAQLTQPDGRTGRDAYLKQIDGMVFGKNPRQGFFRDRTFYHPDLRFQLEFPRGWDQQNLSQAVVGVAPNGSAVLELTLAEGDDDERAFSRFASMPNVQVAQPTRRSFNGLPGLSAGFAVQTPEGRLQGIVALVEQDGRVFQMVGYAPASSFGNAADALSGSIDSFRRLTDPALLKIEANRIDVVELPREQTLGEFVERYPSVVSVDVLAVINHVPGASARFDAGTLVKRVVS
jgi:predicted Zn-dependent protease